jgi:hypothetical protein
MRYASLLPVLICTCSFLALVPTIGCADTVDRVPLPITGAGVPGLIAACGALLVLGRRRRQ